MNLFVSFCRVLIVGIAALACTELQAATHHVVMISIDGLRPEIYLEPERIGLNVPNLVKLRRQGSSAKRMIPVFPSVTYPGHTTLVTGAYPARHGIVANYKRNGQWYLQSSDIKTETLWQAAQRNGLVVAIVTWPASYGADVNFLIPEDLTPGVADITALLRPAATPGLFAQLEQQSGAIHISTLDYARAAEQLDQMTSTFAAQILQAQRPDLLLLHFLNADQRQHVHGPASAEAMSAFESIDRQVGALIQAVEDAGITATTTFVIVGDHGFLPVHTSINVNGLLVDIGFAEVAEDGSVSSPEVWYLPFGGGAAFYLDHPDDAELAARLTTAVNAEVGERFEGLVQFVSRDDLDRLNALPGAVFALVASPGYMFTSAPGAKTMMPATAKGMHGYLPSTTAMATGFILSGAGVLQGVTLSEVRMIDVAPTVARLLGFALGEAEGAPLAAILDGP